MSGSLHSKSTPNLPTLGTFSTSSPPISNKDNAKDLDRNLSPTNTHLPQAASLEDNASDNIFNPQSESESGSEDSNDDTDPNHSETYDHFSPNTSHQPRPRPLYIERASKSYTHLPPSTNNLFPPFYNRPPVPLPPSPSLTSLLRPSFSTQTSRPTTPDSSDHDASHPLFPKGSASNVSNISVGANLSKSAQVATQIPRAHPQVPTYEYYGFALYLASSAAFLIYILWAYLPSPFLHQLGIYYYPNRWWALAVPAWLCMAVGYVYVALASYNTGYLTLRVAEVGCLVDEAAQVAVIGGDGKIVRQGRQGVGVKEKGKGKWRHGRRDEADGVAAMGLYGMDVDWRGLWSEGTDAVMDVPIGGVCEVLYGDGRGSAEENDDA
ncbi:hypothetical protein LTS18_001027 [Coniosporium uncinatum]|uniref:Uncharacterized protein n=1 Tax=Coniosporium uncinatum TaxID=93489 RepID=A0ACC3D844_9PEZI|nr:hypothetical protein LTS18_001027 [Coniosporium uncinatum]